MTGKLPMGASWHEFTNPQLDIGGEWVGATHLKHYKDGAWHTLWRRQTPLDAASMLDAALAGVASGSANIFTPPPPPNLIGYLYVEYGRPGVHAYALTPTGVTRYAVRDFELASIDHRLVGTPGFAVSASFAYLLTRVGVHAYELSAMGATYRRSKNFEVVDQQRASGVAVDGNLLYALTTPDYRTYTVRVYEPNATGATRRAERDFFVGSVSRSRLPVGYWSSLAIAGGFAYVVNREDQRVEVHQLSSTGATRRSGRDFQLPESDHATSIAITDGIAYITGGMFNVGGGLTRTTVRAYRLSSTGATRVPEREFTLPDVVLTNTIYGASDIAILDA